MLVLRCSTLFPPIYREIENWGLECCSRLDLPIFSMMKEVKNGVFQIRIVTDSLVDHSILFTHLCLMLGEKIEAWFVSPASR